MFITFVSTTDNKMLRTKSKTDLLTRMRHLVIDFDFAEFRMPTTVLQRGPFICSRSLENSEKMLSYILQQIKNNYNLIYNNSTVR